MLIYWQFGRVFRSIIGNGRGEIANQKRLIKRELMMCFGIIGILFVFFRIKLKCNIDCYVEIVARFLGRCHNWRRSDLKLIANIAQMTQSFYSYVLNARVASAQCLINSTCLEIAQLANDFQIAQLANDFQTAQIAHNLKHSTVSIPTCQHSDMSAFRHVSIPTCQLIDS